MTDFPWKTFTKNELMDEYYNLIDKIEISTPSNNIKLSRVGYKCSNAFFQYERMKTPSQGKISCYNWWKRNKSKILNNKYKSQQNKHPMEIIAFFNSAPSQFRPYIAGMTYKYFNATKIFDPFAGWGDRCLAAMAMDLDYIGVDCNNHLTSAYKKLIDYYPTKSDITILIDKCENINIEKLDFDFVLTSPPFWNNNKTKLLENYNNSENDYELFMNNCLIPIMKKCLKRNIWFCLYIPKNMYEDIEDIFGKCKKKIYFGTPVNNKKSTEHGKFINNIIYCFKL